MKNKKKIKFSEDYEKLPVFWNGTHATLLTVFPVKMETIKNRYTAFWKFDTKIRGEERYYPLNFKDAIILVFLHHNSGKLFPTIRKNYKEKFEYYTNQIGETFQLKDTRL